MGAFASIPVNLDGKLENPGESLPLAGAIPAGSYTVGERELFLPEGASYDVMFTNTGDGILLTGIVRAHVESTCDRCLEPAAFEVGGEIEEYYLFEEPADEEAFEDGFELIGPDRTVDVAEPISDAVVMETPFVVLCREDCQGLCPVCGVNLNREQCGCAERARKEAAASSENPFAALAALTFDDQDES